ncbi:unnamed protein product [Closterium sp. Yama58-4]|nr:unnamed protein product [Closterium sp. Yama58-4]
MLCLFMLSPLLSRYSPTAIAQTIAPISAAQTVGPTTAGQTFAPTTAAQTGAASFSAQISASAARREIEARDLKENARARSIRNFRQYLLALLAGFPPPVPPLQAERPRLILLPDNSMGARCLDGSPPGFYFRAGTGAGKNMWHIYLPGGAWCVSAGECVERSKTRLGSSTFYPDDPNSEVIRPSFTGILSSNSSINPAFHNWNLVRPIYCDGGGFAGTTGRVETEGGKVLFLDGWKIVRAILDDLKSYRGFKSAAQILLSGSSAGGQAVVSLCDRIAAAFPWAATKCVSDSGFFIDSKDRTGGFTWRVLAKSVVDLHQPKWTCLNGLPKSDQWKCFFPQYTLSSVSSPIFIFQNLFDGVASQIGGLLPWNYTHNVKCLGEILSMEVDQIRGTASADETQGGPGAENHGAGKDCAQFPATTSTVMHTPWRRNLGLHPDLGRGNLSFTSMGSHTSHTSRDVLSRRTATMARLVTLRVSLVASAAALLLLATAALPAALAAGNSAASISADSTDVMAASASRRVLQAAPAAAPAPASDAPPSSAAPSSDAPSSPEASPTQRMHLASNIKASDVSKSINLLNYLAYTACQFPTGKTMFLPSNNAWRDAFEGYKKSRISGGLYDALDVVANSDKLKNPDNKDRLTDYSSLLDKSKGCKSIILGGPISEAGRTALYNLLTFHTADFTIKTEDLDRKCDATGYTFKTLFNGQNVNFKCDSNSNGLISGSDPLASNPAAGTPSAVAKIDDKAGDFFYVDNIVFPSDMASLPGTRFFSFATRFWIRISEQLALSKGLLP